MVFPPNKRQYKCAVFYNLKENKGGGLMTNLGNIFYFRKISEIGRLMN